MREKKSKRAKLKNNRINFDANDKKPKNKEVQRPKEIKIWIILKLSGVMVMSSSLISSFSKFKMELVWLYLSFLKFYKSTVISYFPCWNGPQVLFGQTLR